MGRIKSISIEGFKSIRKLEDFEFKNLNVIVGANGAGKSNFIQIFKMLDAMSHGRFQEFILNNGGADAFPFCGGKETPGVKIDFTFSSNYSKASHFYNFSCVPMLMKEWYYQNSGNIKIINGIIQDLLGKAVFLTK